MVALTCPSCREPVGASFKFCGNCGQKLTPVVQPSAPSTPVIAPPQADERRDVTILFADIKGFTALCEKLDPEDVQLVINECFKGLGHAVQTEGGHIDKYIGDNIMALFGAPVAHEDDVARACRSALQMQAFLLRFGKQYQQRTGVQLTMRIGMHCGLVIAGGIGSEETRRDYSVMGDTVNLASRMEALAEPGTILVTEELAERVRGQFSFGPVRTMQVKGKTHPVPVCTLLGQEAEQETRGRDGFSVALIGREEQVQRLTALWTAPGGAQRWVEIRGDVGLGKTRLVEEVERKFPAISTLKVAASVVTQRRPYGLARRLVQEAFRLEVGSMLAIEQKAEFVQELERLDQSLHSYRDALWFLAARDDLSVPVPDPDPQILRSIVERGIALLLTVVSSNHQGLIIVIDSFELADNESIKVLQSLVERGAGADIRFIATARSEGPTISIAYEHIYLRPLDANDSRALVAALARDQTLPPKLTTEIVRRSGGNPLFIEELVRDVLSSTNDASSANTVTLPASVRAALVARLDRLDAGQREVLRRGSIQGSEFFFDILDCLRTFFPTELDTSIRSLQALQRKSVVADISESQRLKLLFSQPALQEACYETLLVRTRRELHRYTAEALAVLAGTASAVAPELLAYHYEAAEEWSQAAKANLNEGRRASELFLSEKAILHLLRGQESLQKLGPLSAEDRHTYLAILRELALVYLRIGQYEEAEAYAKQLASEGVTAADKAEGKRVFADSLKQRGNITEAREALFEAKSLIESQQQLPTYASIVLDLASLSHRDNNNDTALALLAELRVLLDPNDQVSTIKAKILEGTVLHTMGKFEDALTLYTEAYSLADERSTVSELARALNCLGTLQRDLGDYEQSKLLFHDALQLWQKTGIAHGIAGMHNNLGNLAMSLGEYSEAESHQLAAYEACIRIGNVHGAAMARANLALLAIEQNQAMQAIEGATEALTILGTGGQWLAGLILGVLGDAHLLAAQIEEAERAYQEVLSQYSEGQHPLARAGAIRGLGRVRYAQRAFTESTTLLADAIREFEQLKRVQEAARTRVYYALALIEEGTREQAKEQLLEALAAFKQLNAASDLARVNDALERLTLGN